MKLSEWAKKQGVSYRTALRWFHGGILPVEAEQMDTGTILVKVADPAGFCG
jgi:putative resolvase